MSLVTIQATNQLLTTYFLSWKDMTPIQIINNFWVLIFHKRKKKKKKNPRWTGELYKINSKSIWREQTTKNAKLTCYHISEPYIFEREITFASSRYERESLSEWEHLTWEIERDWITEGEREGEEKGREEAGSLEREEKKTKRKKESG